MGLVGSKGPSKRSRIQRMLQGFRDLPIRINVERARLFTDSFKETEGQQIVLRWAIALADILRKHPIHIESEEIIVGSARSFETLRHHLSGAGRQYFFKGGGC